MISRWIVLLLVIPILLSAQTMPPAPPGEEGIRKLVDSFVDAWNRHDVHAFAAVVRET